MWAVGKGTVLRWPGGPSWVSASSPSTDLLYEVWGEASTNVWVASIAGHLYNWNGSGWTTTTTSPVATLWSVFGTGAGQSWAVGGDFLSTPGYVFHRGGASWSQVTLPFTATPLFDGWGSSAQDVWAVGFGMIVRKQDTTWTQQNVGKVLMSVWGFAGDRLWMVGDGDGILTKKL